MLAAVRARDPRTAARSAELILLVCATALGGLTALQAPTAPDAVLASWLGVLTLLGAAAVCRFVPAETLDRVGFCVGIALTGVLMASTLNFMTADSTITGQAFLAFPVLWGASHLRRGGVTLVTSIAVVADALGLYSMLPAEPATTDFVFFGAVLIVMSVMLDRANDTQERLVDALREQARVDALTGLVNRRVFEEALESTAAEPRSAGTALVLIDVDSFKSINDAHGHPVGDDVLVHLAGVLRDQVRFDDAVLSRLGGDELAVLLPRCAADVAARRGEDLLEAVRARPLSLPDGTLLSLSISVGVAHAPGIARDVRTLHSAADAALYAAKRAGRGRVSVATA